MIWTVISIVAVFLLGALSSYYLGRWSGFKKGFLSGYVTGWNEAVVTQSQAVSRTIERFLVGQQAASTPTIQTPSVTEFNTKKNNSN